MSHPGTSMRQESLMCRLYTTMTSENLYMCRLVMVRCPMLHAMRKVPEVIQLNMRVSYMLNVTKYDYSSSEPYGHVHVFHWADGLRNKAEVEVQRLSQQFLRAG